MITPHQLDLWSANMADLYNSLEGEIIRNMIIHLGRNKGSKDISLWQAEKLSELRSFNSEVTSYLAKVTKRAEPEIRQMFEVAGRQMVLDIDKSVPYEPKPMPTNLDAIMRSYSNQVWLDIDNYVNQTLVTTNYGVGGAQRAYQGVLNQTAAMFNSGLHSFEDSLERAITNMAQQGIKTTLIDRGGHTWSLERYTRTVLKSTLSNTYDEVRKERMSEYGVHTVVVTSHVGARKQCELIQGNVVDLREPSEIPEDSEYKSIYDPDWGADYGEAGGHRGVNCAHLHIPFVPGVNTNNQPQYDQALNDRVHNAQQTQRRIEREIVKYKKNLMVSEELGSDKVGHWRKMVRKRQGAMRDLIDQNDDYLVRNYKREKVYTPLDALLNDFSYKGN